MNHDHFRLRFPILSGIILVCVAVRWLAASDAIRREDLFTNSDAGVQIHVREARADTHRACDPILLVHGARVPGVASFDLSVPGGSLAADLADKGFCAYVMDVRGYGKSTRPPEMQEPPENHAPLVCSVETVRDIDAAIELIRRRTGTNRVSLFG